jgi:membrane protein YqaA with SNARE-associated domain
MVELALDWGYAGLFVLSFVAATLIAAPSDVLAMAMPPVGFNPVWVALVATLGGYLGNLVNYAVGRYGAKFVLGRWVDYDPDADADSMQKRAERLYDRYGVWTLLLSGTPFIGDPLTTVAGGFGVRLWVFSVLVIIGKLAKFALLLGAVDVVFRLFAGQ